ncbi:outer membrane lipoprotein carrier protein LolA [Paraburkholderia sp. Tr-20389]|uniref:outer membrane lipoprotein carrier protein LolA n=1 Tax=Paraburkholderia sp. Tr-20389 TaxID=2703903 RepID=UPI00197F9BE2|nr:outer membrane lipoprotein carrier protein LolA [Paraburkholderia sp. Tr-20389]MBN3757862.1 outer membrane lipoprotein carrier protein LolA [Paraburkholderia sp. Tr-20389]
MGTLNLRAALTAALLVAASGSPFGAVQAATQAQAQNGNAALVSQVAARLAQAKGVRAQFTQTQTLSAMKQPLVSTGTLVFFRERGVIWRVDTPYKATYVIGDAGVSEVDANGKRINTKSAQGVRGVAQVSKMMRAMLGGDLSALYSQFDVDAQGTPSQWRLDLKPNQPQLAQSIKGLQMTGGEFLQTLRITLANGDVTQIDFAKSEAITDLAPGERSLLGAQ